ncbi:MAG: hypothetical protein MZW92_18790 [Comamonadaceae bacterium]|nr:hypothetical protein [Comamonadaceae bacterium]
MLAAHGQAFGPQVRQYHRLFVLPAVGHYGGSTGPSSIERRRPEPPAAYRPPEHAHGQRGDQVGRGRRGAGEDRRFALQRRDAGPPAPGLPLSGAGALQRHRQHRRRGELHLLHPGAAGARRRRGRPAARAQCAAPARAAAAESLIVCLECGGARGQDPRLSRWPHRPPIEGPGRGRPDRA